MDSQRPDRWHTVIVTYADGAEERLSFSSRDKAMEFRMRCLNNPKVKTAAIHVRGAAT